MDSVLVLAGFGQVLRQLGPRALGLTGTRISVVGDRPEVLGYANGRLVVGDTTEVQAFDPATGRRLWRVPGGATFLTISGGVVSAFFTAIVVSRVRTAPLWSLA